ncbi:MAG TPA: hypothetical protein VIS73_04590 [Rhodocyclaceae bacterium]
MGQDSGTRRAQARFQSGLLAWLRSSGQPEGLRDMVAVVRELSADDGAPGDKMLWRSADSFLAALLDGTLSPDDEAKGLARRIERRLASGSAETRSADDASLREALFAWISRRTLPPGNERASIAVADLPAAGLSSTLAATAELLPLLGGRLLPARCSDEQLKQWTAGAEALDRAWSALLRDGLDPCRKAATTFVSTALEIGDPACLKLAEALATAVGCAEDPAWRDAAALRAAIAGALDLARDRQGPNHPSFGVRTDELVRRIETAEEGLRSARRDSGATGKHEAFIATARERLKAVATLLEATPSASENLREALGWFETQRFGNSMAIRGLVVLWREALAKGRPEALAAPGRQALAALGEALDGLALGRAPHPDIAAFAALRAVHRAVS